MGKQKLLRYVAINIALGAPIVFSQNVFAASGNVNEIENFIKSIIQIIAGLAGLIATGFFVLGGFKYITSSGKPNHLESAKRTILYSALGLSIVIAAFVISNIVTDLATKSFGG